jgi:hypothetical protein
MPFRTQRGSSELAITPIPKRHAAERSVAMRTREAQAAHQPTTPLRRGVRSCATIVSRLVRRLGFMKNHAFRLVDSLLPRGHPQHSMVWS